MHLNTSKLLTVFKSGESETVEFKTSFDKETIETLSAFANTKGGAVFVGVTDTGNIKGVVLAKETIQNWINQIKMSSPTRLSLMLKPLTQAGKLWSHWLLLNTRSSRLPAKGVITAVSKTPITR